MKCYAIASLCFFLTACSSTSTPKNDGRQELTNSSKEDSAGLRTAVRGPAFRTERPFYFVCEGGVLSSCEATIWVEAITSVPHPIPMAVELRQFGTVVGEWFIDANSPWDGVAQFSNLPSGELEVHLRAVDPEELIRSGVDTLELRVDAFWFSTTNPRCDSDSGVCEPLCDGGRCVEPPVCDGGSCSPNSCDGGPCFPPDADFCDGGRCAPDTCDGGSCFPDLCDGGSCNNHSCDGGFCDRPDVGVPCADGGPCFIGADAGV